MLSKRAVLQSVCNNYEELINLTSPHNAEYAAKIGFEYILHKKNYFSLLKSDEMLPIFAKNAQIKEIYI